MHLVSQSESGEPWDPVITDQAQRIVGVQTKFGANEIDGDLIKSTDKRILLDSSIKPDVSMRLRDEGVDYSIISVETIAPGTQVIIYKLQVRV